MPTMVGDNPPSSMFWAALKELWTLYGVGVNNTTGVKILPHNGGTALLFVSMSQQSHIGIKQNDSVLFMLNQAFEFLSPFQTLAATWRVACLSKIKERTLPYTYYAVMPINFPGRSSINNTNTMREQWDRPKSYLLHKKILMTMVCIITVLLWCTVVLQPAHWPLPIGNTKIDHMNVSHILIGQIFNFKLEALIRGRAVLVNQGSPAYQPWISIVDAFDLAECKIACLITWRFFLPSTGAYHTCLKTKLFTVFVET